MQRYQIHNSDLENMNTVEESAISHEKEHRPNNVDDDVEKGRRNEQDHQATGTPTGGSSVKHLRRELTIHQGSTRSKPICPR
jgi:hypothetical protein